MTSFQSLGISRKVRVEPEDYERNIKKSIDDVKRQNCIICSSQRPGHSPEVSSKDLRDSAVPS